MSGAAQDLASSCTVARPSDASATALAKSPSAARSCRICLSRMLAPATLGCGHAFCEQCLDRYWEVREKPSFIVCPLCRDEAIKIRFEKKEKPTCKTKAFRKAFNGDEEPTGSTKAILLIKILLIVPVSIYMLLKLLNTLMAGLLFDILKDTILILMFNYET